MAKDYTIAWKPFETQLAGEPVTMELLPLSRAAVFAISPAFDSRDDSVDRQVQEYMQANQADFKTAFRAVLASDPKLAASYGASTARWSNALIDAARPYLPERVRNIQGFTLDGGQPGIEQLVDLPAFMELVVSIITELIVRSGLKAIEVKN